MQYNRIYYNTIQCNIMQYNRIQCNTIKYNSMGGVHFTFGASPQHILLHFPIHLLHFPNKFASFPQQIASFPQQIASFPQQIAAFPQPDSHFPMQCCVTLPKTKIQIYQIFSDLFHLFGLILFKMFSGDCGPMCCEIFFLCATLRAYGYGCFVRGIFEKTL